LPSQVSFVGMTPPSVKAGEVIRNVMFISAVALIGQLELTSPADIINCAPPSGGASCHRPARCLSFRTV
jgi:hypothetical protein